MRRLLIPITCAFSVGFSSLLLLGAAKKPAGIPAWEYKVLGSEDFLQVDGKRGPTTNEFLAEQLKKQGDEGWEFTAVAMDSWVFKRPVID